MKKSCLRKIFLATVLAFLGAALPLSAQESYLCSNRTLQGDYAFSIAGDATPIPTRGVAMAHFDGEGNFTQVDHVVVNGVPPAVDWRPGAGTYTVNADCTGKAILTNEGRPPMPLYFVIVGQGAEIRTVVSLPGTASTSVGTKRN
jgi:hypothetical protein